MWFMIRSLSILCYDVVPLLLVEFQLLSSEREFYQNKPCADNVCVIVYVWGSI